MPERGRLRAHSEVSLSALNALESRSALTQPRTIELATAIKLIVNTTNVKIRLAGPRYETLGPWCHGPDDPIEHARQNQRQRVS